MSLRGRTIRGVIWSGVQTGGAETISTVVFLLLARLLAPEAFGVVAFASVVVAFLQVFVKQGLGVALVQRPDLREEHIDAAFWANMAAAVVLAVAAVGLALPVSALLGNEELGPVLRAMAALFPLMALTVVPEALLTREMRFKSLAFRSIAAAAAGGVVGVVFALRGAGVWSLVAMQIVNSVVGVAALWGACKWRPRARFSWPALRELASFSGNVIGVNLVGFAQLRADQFIIGAMLGATALGHYHIAQRIVQILVRLIAQPLTHVALPALSSLQGEPHRLRRAVVQAAEAPSMLTIPAFLGLASIAPELVLVVLGGEWLSAAVPMRWLAISAAFRMVTYYGVPVQYAAGKPRLVLLVTVAELAYSVIVFTLAARMGAGAVAIAHAGRSTLMTPLWWALTSRTTQAPVRRLIGAVLPTVGASIIMVGCIQLSREAMPAVGGGAVALAALIGLGVVSYLVIAWLLYRETIMRYLPMLRGGS